MLPSRLTRLGALMIGCAALATASSALGLRELHYLFKPLTMLVAMALVWQREDDRAQPTATRWLLLAALGGSLAGDVFLMLPGDWFIAGLASFLLAQLFYIALFRIGQRWFPSAVALALTLGFGAAMLALLWNSLGDPLLKTAVTIYVTVIALMAAQAIGRAAVLRDGGSTLVAVGAGVFMLSDTLIAVNRFLAPVPLSGLWILSTYYLAQILIVLHAPGRVAQTRPRNRSSVTTGAA